MATNEDWQGEEALARARAGEEGALGQLLERYRPYLVLLARLQIGRRLQGKADPDDLVQETFLEAARHFGQFRGETEPDLAAWLRQVLAGCLSHLVRHYCGTMPGNERLIWLRHPAVRDDLRTSHEQGERIAELSRRLEEKGKALFVELHRLTQDQRDNRFLEESRANDAAVKTVLSAEQLRRLKQIALQARGVGRVPGAGRCRRDEADGRAA